MEVQLIKLNKIKVNDKNPRTITEDKLRRLVENILVFPKMLTIRPIVVDGKPLEQLRRRLLVSHRHGAFVCIERQKAPFDDKVWDIISNQDCIIIGNIHDNPELLGK